MLCGSRVSKEFQLRIQFKKNELVLNAKTKSSNLITYGTYFS